MQHDSDPVFTLDCVVRLFHRKKRQLRCAGWIGAGFAFILLLFFPTQYKIEASFKEKAEQGGPEASIRDFFLQGLRAVQQPEAISVMKSHRVLKPVIEAHGLQGNVSRGPLQLFRRLRNHLYAEFRWKQPEEDWFSFANIQYEGEEKIDYGLQFSDHSHFQVLRGKKVLARGEVGKAVSFENVSFVLAKAPARLFLRKKYSLCFYPWIAKAKLLQKKLKIIGQKTNKSIYDLILYFPDRKQGAAVLNGLMEEYRVYLKQDHDEIAAEQLAYLEEKQGQLFEKMDEIFDEHAAYLEGALGARGFLSLEQEIQSYLEPHRELRSKLMSLDMEIERLQGAFSENKDLAQKRRELEEERNFLAINLERELTCGDPFSLFTSASSLDLPASRSLYADYAKNYDQTKNRLEALSQAGDFELEALSNLLRDPLSQELIAKASTLSLHLKDQKYSTEKERKRWSEELALQKKILLGHVEELIKVETSNASILRDKMGALQKSSLESLNRQLGVLSEESKDETRKQIETLQEEKKLFQKKMEELKWEALKLPERWKLENWLTLKTDLGKEVMTVMTELVESKTIGHHLFHIESKPLDLALGPRLAENSHFLLIEGLSAFGFALAAFCSSFAAAALKGFPLSPGALKLRYPYSGKLSQELETFRQLSSFLDRKIIALLGGKGPDYSKGFAAYLARFEKKVLLIDCSFSGKEGSGLVQWFSGEIKNIPIIPFSNYFFLPSGGFSPYGTEIFQSKRFQSFLETARSVYDYLLLWHEGIFETAETKSLLAISEKGIVTISNEQREELTLLLHWAYHNGNCRITFISSPDEG